MTRYIDADALKEQCGDWYTEEGTEVGFIGSLGTLLDKAPTVDAIPIDYLRSQIDCGKWEEIITRWKEKTEADHE